VTNGSGRAPAQRGGPGTGKVLTAGAIGAGAIFVLALIANLMGLVTFVSGRSGPDLFTSHARLSPSGTMSPVPQAPPVSTGAGSATPDTPPVPSTATSAAAPTAAHTTRVPAQPVPSQIVVTRTVASDLAVRVQPSSFANPGHALTLVVTVQGASRGGFVDIDMFYPDTAPYHGGVCSNLRPGNRCSSYLSNGGDADNWGEISFTVTWSPLFAYYLDASDVEGDWPVAVRDRDSSRITSTTFVVHNDADTPPPDNWS
jgi:hypothetical protein